jgi:hypothetical protein
MGWVEAVGGAGGAVAWTARMVRVIDLRVVTVGWYRTGRRVPDGSAVRRLVRCSWAGQ